MHHREPHTIRYFSPFKFFADVRRDPLGFFSNAARSGDVIRFRVGFSEAWLLTHPSHVERVLKDHQDNYRNENRVNRIFRLAGGDGLLTTDGDLWRRQRRIAQPAFHRNRIVDSAAVMITETEAMLDRWNILADTRAPFDFSREMTRLALMIAGRAFCGADLGADVDTLADAITAAFEYFNHRLFHALTMPMAIRTRLNRRFAATARTIERIVGSLVDARILAGGGADLLAAVLAGGQTQREEGLSDSQILDAIVTFLGAATETTAVALTWTWYLIATNPEVEHLLRQEISHAIGLRLPSALDVPALDYTRRVVQESLRLFPPAWAMVRTAIEEDELDNYILPRGSSIVMSPYLTHRRADVWEDPLRADPERFTVERSQGRPEFAYFPFGGGPRRCIGEGFAMTEMILVVAAIVQRYRLRLVPVCPVEPRVLFTMRHRSPVMMIAEHK